MAGKKSKKNKKNKKNKEQKPGGISAIVGDDFRRVLRDMNEKMMNDLCEVYGDHEQNKEALRGCAATIEAYAEYVNASTGDQYMFNLQSKYSSDETVEVTFVDDESTLAAEYGDLQPFAYTFEKKFLDKPMSKTGKPKGKEGPLEKERTTLIKSDSDAKGRATAAFNNTDDDDEEKSVEDLVGLEEQLMEMRI